MLFASSSHCALYCGLFIMHSDLLCVCFITALHTLMRFYIHRYAICNAAYSSCFAIYNAACIFNDLLALMKLAFSLLWSCNAVCIIIRIASFNAANLSCIATCYAFVSLPHCNTLMRFYIHRYAPSNEPYLL